MPSNRLAAGAVGVLLIAFFLSWQSMLSPATPRIPPAVGTNNTALFLVTSDHGLSNVHVATAHALLERHPHVQLHFGSFAPMASKLKRISSYVQHPDAKEIVFHQIEGLSVMGTCSAFGKNTSNSVHPPGWAGIGQLCKDMQLYVSPWTGEDHLRIYERIKHIIDAVDPAVIVLDTLFRPAIDATRDLNRLHAIISPNTLIETFPADQPWGKMFWKYPAMGSGFPYPVPWSKIPENILLNLRFISTMMRMPEIKEKQAFLKSNGLKDPINFLQLHRPDVPWLSQTMPGASIPFDLVPQNVTCTGPMTLSLSTVADQDAELAGWLEGAPTVLVNLGSGFGYSETQAVAMAQALAKVLEDTIFQVLWKFQTEDDYDDKYMEPLAPFVNDGRVRVERWLAADPPALLESGHIITSVHHGGSGCYHEALSAGIPQVILPQWLDLYGFARLSEYIGVGVWGCPETSPTWTSQCLYEAILRVARSNESQGFQDKAKEFGRLAQADPGRYIAAREIARLAESGA
ncbi:hypothetical protein NUW58_g990 [Xylaria curta]|uniref:Uncharacterized protein n=1 Tax=Xylaria curta TaxID=42375 RepID=A0ACC1PQH5_9PEZI|nr:hypothetical protein NUW58_g990 [Xylaria curta]